MMKTKCFAAFSPVEELSSHTIIRRKIGKKDILIEIEYCGVCHTDYHYAKNDWGITRYPSVPGHEIIGIVVDQGSEVKKTKIGDRVAVGCFVDSCRVCEPCINNLEQYCTQGLVKTYNDLASFQQGHTFGGYSKFIVVDKHFVFSIPETLDPAGAAPLLCAGITTFSPLNHWQIKKGKTVGIIGLGGLGHMAVKFSSALGAKTIVFTSSEGKSEDALTFGADDVVITKNLSSLEKLSGKFDFLLNTVPAPHNFNVYMSLLKVDGTMCIVGSIGPTNDLNTRPLIFGRRRIAGSLVGGVEESQKMLNFCGENNIVSEIEKIDMKYINHAFMRMVKNDVKYRFVIDMKSL